MVTPVIEESQWQSRLRDLPVWRPPLQPALILSPHPDDETLGAGGLIRWFRVHDVPISVLAVTDGEAAYPGTPHLAATREQEQTEALACLGVEAQHIHRLRLPDSNVAAHEPQLVDALLHLVTPQTHLIAPWPGDFHPDHEACGRAARTVAQLRRLPLTSYFFWTWHRGDEHTLDGLPLVALPVSAADRDIRRQALFCHRSQLQHSSGEPILPPYLLEPLDRSFEVFLPS